MGIFWDRLYSGVPENMKQLKAMRKRLSAVFALVKDIWNIFFLYVKKLFIPPGCSRILSECYCI